MRLPRNNFEFRVEEGFSVDSAMVFLRRDGYLVNPVIEFSLSERRWYTDRLIVEFASYTDDSVRNEIVAASGCEVAEISNWFPDTYFLRVSDSAGESVIQAAERIALQHGVRAAYPEAISSPRINSDSTPHDYRYMQWANDNRGDAGGITDADIDAIHAWRASTGSPNVKIAVLDGGFSAGWVNPFSPDVFDHEDVAHGDTSVFVFDEITDSWNGKNPSCASTSIDWLRAFCAHGTAVLGVMAGAHNEIGIDGLAPDCYFTGMKIYASDFDHDSRPLIIAQWPTEALLRAAFDWQYKVIVNSWDIWPRDTAEFRMIFRALDTVRNYAHAAIFFAAGNDSVAVAESAPLASDPNVFTVGATNRCPVSLQNSHVVAIPPIVNCGTTSATRSASRRWNRQTEMMRVADHATATGLQVGGLSLILTSGR